MVVVAGEDASKVHEATNRDAFLSQFATLTLGPGATAAVIGPSDHHPEGHRILHSVTRAGTEFNHLCAGDHKGMSTDSAALLANGLDLVMAAWNDADPAWKWSEADRYITHQVSSQHTNAIIQAAGIDPDTIPVTFPDLGNIGPAALPVTLAREKDKLSPGDSVLCMGVGSGLNVAMLDLQW